MLPLPRPRALVNAATGLVLVATIVAGVLGFAREIGSNRRGVPSAIFPPEMPIFRRAVFAVLPPDAGLIFVDAGDDPWVGVLLEQALYPHPVWIIRGSPEKIEARIQWLKAGEHLRFLIAAGRPPTVPGLRRARPLPRLSGFSSEFLLGVVDP